MTIIDEALRQMRALQPMSPADRAETVAIVCGLNPENPVVRRALGMQLRRGRPRKAAQPEVLWPVPDGSSASCALNEARMLGAECAL